MSGQYNGIVLLELKEVEVTNKDGLKKALEWLIPSIVEHITSYKGTPEDTSVSGALTGVGIGGASGSVTVTTKGNQGSVSGTVSGSTSGGVTGGTITGTWTF